MNREDFETRPEFGPIIATARNSKALPVPAGFTDAVMSRIENGSVDQSHAAAWLHKWTCAASNRELGHCFLVSGFFYLVLALTLYWGGQAMPTATWMRWPAAGGLAAAVLFGGLGAYLLLDGSTAVRIAEIGAAACVAALVIPAAVVTASAASFFDAGAAAFFILVGTGPSLFLAATAHRYRSGRLCRKPTTALL